VLFNVVEVFRCRGCHDLAYSGSRLDAVDRGTKKIRQLQRKLGAPVRPDKSAGMYWTMHDRLVWQL
jgi:hypothetical protein